MRIISASRKEDMVAFGANKILNRFKHEKTPSFWVFWTKNPKNLINMPLDYSRCALQLTVTGLGGTAIEPNVPNSESVLKSVHALIGKGFNPALINWRYDPIIPGFSKSEDLNGLAKQFSSLGVNRCMTSFITWYGSVKERWPEGKATQVSDETQRKIVLKAKEILDSYNITLFGCAQPHLADLVIPSKCIDGDYYSSVTGFDFNNEKDEWQRKACGCTQSDDIGNYSNCFHNCKYCYASPSLNDSKDEQMEMF